MPARPQNGQSPAPPASHPPRTEPPQRDDASRLPNDDFDDEKIPLDFGESTQPHDEDGVMEDMATLAVNPGVLEGVLPATAAQGSAHFHELEDSAIMLELRAGNMSGFDFLIQKYRKPIIN